MFFSCLLRIVDSFGTEPAYNLRAYAKSHKILTSWGGQDLLPQQFFTMFRKKKILYKNTHLISVIFQSNDWIRWVIFLCLNPHYFVCLSFDCLLLITQKYLVDHWLWIKEKPRFINFKLFWISFQVIKKSYLIQFHVFSITWLDLFLKETVGINWFFNI